jgi:hypothetical protein
MSTKPTNGSETKVSVKSGRYKNQVGKSPGRVAAGKRLHAEGLAGIGRRRPTHGRRMLVELLKRGLDADSPVAALRREATDVYVADEGGPENVSGKGQGVIRRMVGLDLGYALLDAQLDKAGTLPRKVLLELFAAQDRNAAAYNSCVKTMGGIGRREKDAGKGVVIVRRQYGEAPQPNTGTTKPGRDGAEQERGQ